MLSFLNDAETVVPRPGKDSSAKEPPHKSASCFRKGSPKPTLRSVLEVKKGSTTERQVCSSIPLPLSVTVTIISSGPSSIFTEIESAPAFIPFSAISRICWERSSSILDVFVQKSLEHRRVVGEPAMSVVVYHDYRRQTAATETGYRFKCKSKVFRGTVLLNIEH